MNDTQTKISNVCNLLKNTLLAKNADYGDSAFESPLMCPELNAGLAIRVRMSDKIKRILQLENNPDNANVKTENLIDTYLDLAGYAILRICELQRQISPTEMLYDCQVKFTENGPVVSSGDDERKAMTDEAFLMSELFQAVAAWVNSSGGYQFANAEKVQQRYFDIIKHQSK